MKSILLALFTVVSISSYAQSEVNFLNALGESNVSKLSSYLADNVNLCINDSQEMVPKSEVIKKVQSTLIDQGIENFKLLHQGKSNDKSSSYRVARIKTKSSMFRVFAYSEGDKEGKVIEVRIDNM